MRAFFNHSRLVLGQLYLPERRFCSMDFLRGVLNGRKSVFKNSEVQRVKVPRYKQLTLEKVMQHCLDKPKILRYLPDFPVTSEAPCDREFLFTVVNTIDSNYFPRSCAR